MSTIQDIFEKYAQLRENGMDAERTLQALKSIIDALSDDDRETLAQHFYAWEAGVSKVSGKPKPPGGIDTSQDTLIHSDLTSDMVKAASEQMKKAGGNNAVEWVTCQNCGKANQKHEYFCYSCGMLLNLDGAVFKTNKFGDDDEPEDSRDYFGRSSVLALQVAHNNRVYEVRPQLYLRQIIGGRVTGTAMMPDIDLTDSNAVELGVSRLHFGIQFDRQRLRLSDLESANGTFLNGQSLRPDETRVLLHGDELRVGHMDIRVIFRHPKQDE